MPLPPLLVREPLERLLDEHGIGSGPLEAELLGEGHSNVTFLLRRGGTEAVLRRPPRPPFAPGAHDVLREARFLAALDGTGARAPEVLLTADDRELLDVPFYVMAKVEGHVITSTLPSALDPPAQRRRIADELVDGLVELHRVDARAPAIAAFGDGERFLERQLRRWSRIWEQRRARDLPEVEQVLAWLAANRPRQADTTVVHGDYRLGNVVFAPEAPARLAAILDWEIATVGDPLVDLGWLLASWPEPGDDDGAILSLAGAVAGGDFPGRAELAERYAAGSGRPLRDVGWYTTFAFWRGAIGLETIYAQAVRGTTDDPYALALESGVPELARRALREARAAR
nr:phosphotransferase family protein [Conexibacter arvalis]